MQGFLPEENKSIRLDLKKFKLASVALIMVFENLLLSQTVQTNMGNVAEVLKKEKKRFLPTIL